MTAHDRAGMIAVDPSALDSIQQELARGACMGAGCMWFT